MSIAIMEGFILNKHITIESLFISVYNVISKRVILIGGVLRMFDVACVGILVADAIARTVDGLPESGKLQLTDKIAIHL